MKKYRTITTSRKLLADILTPVSIYLKIRDRFRNPILLESSDYAGNQNNYSFICCEPMAEFRAEGAHIRIQYPGEEEQVFIIGGERQELIAKFQDFLDAFENPANPYQFPNHGLFGYTSYDAVRYFEDLEVKTYPDAKRKIPDILYRVYRYVIAINHFKNELYLFEHQIEGIPIPSQEYNLDTLETIIYSKNFPAYSFETEADESSNMDDEDYRQMVKKGIEHCQLGDVFQIVLSRQFNRRFQGDEFNVYRALRSINPSPYLFYFDYGNFKIFGSSPEAQLVIQDQKAEIHPIAGTFKRTGHDEEDAELARQLFDDEKENSEHVMLVDLARNDLSRNGSHVQVENFKEIQFFSHLIHLVSKVTARVEESAQSLRIYGDTFPAGTLSGAPKIKAMELINTYENQNRGFYGGAIGYLSFGGDLNHAIMIRSFLSRNNRLYFQAGAGIVSKSDPQKELEEVANKLRALRTAIDRAENI